MEKRKEKKGWGNLTFESLGGRGPAVSLWLKPKAAPKNGGTEDWRTVAASLTRHRPEAWRIYHFCKSWPNDAKMIFWLQNEDFGAYFGAIGRVL